MLILRRLVEVNEGAFEGEKERKSRKIWVHFRPVPSVWEYKGLQLFTDSKFQTINIDFLL